VQVCVCVCVCVWLRKDDPVHVVCTCRKSPQMDKHAYLHVLTSLYTYFSLLYISFLNVREYKQCRRLVSLEIMC